MARTPEEIQGAMRKAKAAGDTVATAGLRAMLKEAYSTEYSAASESGLENFTAGLGSGMVDIGRKATNLVLPDSLTPEWASDEAIDEQFRLDEDLMETGAGLTGNILGGIAATAPAGFGASALIGKALPGALKAAGTWGRVGGRALQGMGQGAAEGALISRPGDRGVGAAIGGALGGALPLAAGAIGKGVRSLGRPAAKISDEAAALEQRMVATKADDLMDASPGLSRREAVELATKGGVSDMGEDIIPSMIPLSQSAKPGIVKQIYEGFVSNIPGNNLRQQRLNAVNEFREVVLKEAAPEGVSHKAIFEAGDDLQQGFKRLIQEWDNAWKPVNKADVNVPRNLFSEDVRQVVSKAGYDLPGAGANKGESLTLAMQAIQEVADELPPGVLGSQQRTALLAAKKNTENFLRGQLDGDAAATWDKNRRRFRDFQNLVAGSKGKIGTGEFTPIALAQAAGRRAGTEGLGGAGGPMQELGRQGGEALKDFPSKMGIFQTLAATGAAGGAAGTAIGGWGEGTVVGGAMGPILAVLGAKYMARPAVQKALRDGWGLARKSGMTLDNYRRGVEAAGTGVNQAAIAAALEGLK